MAITDNWGYVKRTIVGSFWLLMAQGAASAESLEAQSLPCPKKLSLVEMSKSHYAACKAFQILESSAFVQVRGANKICYHAINYGHGEIKLEPVKCEDVPRGPSGQLTKSAR